MEVRSTETTPPNPLRMLIYGKAKSGKTTFCSTAPGRVVFIVPAIEMGINSLAGMKHVDYIIVRSTEELRQAALYVKANYKARQWRSIAIDVATVFGRVAQMEISQHGQIAIQKHMWGLILALFLGVRDTLHECDAHVFWVMHVDEITTNDGSTILSRGPKLVGASLQEIKDCVDIIAYLDTVEVPELVQPDKTVVPPHTERRLWVRCPNPMPNDTDGIPFEACSRYSKAFVTKDKQGNTIPVACYQPDFKVLAKYLAPRDEQGKSTGQQYITL